MSKRPHIICHMASSIDSKIDASTLRNVMRAGEYEALYSKLGGNAWICGRTTMQQHFADAEPFISKTNDSAEPQQVHVARHADSYAVSVDTWGKLRWSSNDLSGDHLICVVSEQIPTDYLIMLREKEISYIVGGAKSVDLVKTVELLAEHFGSDALLLEGGGHINGGVLQAGLVEEISLLLLSGVDGPQVPAVFDGFRAANHNAVPIQAQVVERRDNDALWIRYDIVRHWAQRNRWQPPLSEDAFEFTPMRECPAVNRLQANSTWSLFFCCKR